MYRFNSDIYTREDLARALTDLLENERPYFVNENSGFDFGTSGGCYTPEGTYLEGWARQLWGIAPFLKGGFHYEHMDEFLKGLKTGPDRDGHFYWGAHKDYDQRFVENASISNALLVAPDKIWEPLSDREKRNLYLYLDDINHHEFSDNNWVMFRVLTNLAFESLGLPFREDLIQKDVGLIESYYVKDGWYKDKVPFDYYNSWALHYYMIVYYMYRKDKEPERCALIRERAFEFAQQFKTFFNEEGGNLPYGRSLTYRFGAPAFFSACAKADLEVLPWGVIKGIVLRNLRWWFSKPIFSETGTLSVGFWYNTHVVMDEYNAPGAPYWGLKTFAVLGLPEDHPFWTSKEEPIDNPKTKYLEVPSGIMVHTNDDDVIYLTNGQNPLHRMNQVTAKYTKFAYSVNRGYNGDVGGHELQHLALDNVLLFAEEDDTYWRTRDYTKEKYGNDEMLKAVWNPMRNVTCTTWLIPHDSWHVRIHEIVTDRIVDTVEGGFPITMFMGDGHETEKAVRDNLTISYPWGYTSIYPIGTEREGFVDTPMTNANSNYPNVYIPALKGRIEKGRHYLVTLVGCGKDPDGDQTKPTVGFNERELTVTINGETLKLI